MKALENLIKPFEKIADNWFEMGYIGWIGIIILIGVLIYFLIKVIF